MIDGSLRLDTPDGTWGLLGLDDGPNITNAPASSLLQRLLSLRKVASRSRWSDPTPHWLATRQLLASLDPGVRSPTGPAPSRQAHALRSGTFLNDLLLPPVALIAALMLLVGWDHFHLWETQLVNPACPWGWGSWPAWAAPWPFTASASPPATVPTPPPN